MNAFAIAAVAFMALFLPLLGIAVVRRPIDGAVALSLAGTLAVLTLLCLAEALHRSYGFTVPVVASVMTLVGGLVFARFLGRWL